MSIKKMYSVKILKLEIITKIIILPKCVVVCRKLLRITNIKKFLE